MRTYPTCYPCMVRQAVNVLQQNQIEPEIQFQALKKVLNCLALADPNLSPSEIAGETNRIIRETIDLDDLYLEEKKASHQLAMSYLDDLRQLAGQGTDPLEQALKISAAGNVIDVIHIEDYDLWTEVQASVNGRLVGGGLEAFRERLSTVSHLLVLADNVGETVFDRVLIETLSIPVIYAVKSGPILNDAGRQDAEAAGIDQLAEIVENGTRSPGTVLSQTAPEFRELFERSSLVLSKGQANYETMDEQGDKVFFLLRIKCPLLSEKLNAPQGSVVLKQGGFQ
ncbi:MAG: ARMT1-like domain-containing protein [Anaerolineales bacterium]